MRRREFIAGLTGAAAWPLTVRAQERMRRVGVLMNLAKDDAETVERHAAFVQELRKLGWVENRNVRLDYRYAQGDNERLRELAQELVSLAPDVIVANAAPSAQALRQTTRSVPVVFAAVIDPVGAGLVASLARPGGNITGFTSHEFGLSAKWLDLLKSVAPKVRRIAVIRDAASSTGIGHFASLQSVAPSFGVELTPIGVHDADELKSGITAFARIADSGIIGTPSTLAISRRNLIIALATQFQMPAVYPHRVFIKSGGLMSYGVDRVDQYRRAAAYVDRILRGESPSDLPVQASSKYDLGINLRTAKALGINVPQSLLATADEVIE